MIGYTINGWGRVQKTTWDRERLFRYQDDLAHWRSQRHGILLLLLISMIYIGFMLRFNLSSRIGLSLDILL